MKRSILAAVVAFALALLSMGLLGGVLYYAVYPVFAPFFGNLDDWQGDNVWPAVLCAGMLWAPSFLAAGWVAMRLARRGAGAWPRRIAYGVTLWLGAVFAWALTLSLVEVRTAMG